MRLSIRIRGRKLFPEIENSFIGVEYIMTQNGKHPLIGDKMSHFQCVLILIVLILENIHSERQLPHWAIGHTTAITLDTRHHGKHGLSPEQHKYTGVCANSFSANILQYCQSGDIQMRVASVFRDGNDIFEVNKKL